MVKASYFDGHSARQQAVALYATPGVLEVRGEGVARAETLSGVRISAKLGSAPRLIYFADGAHCQINDHAGFDALLQQAGVVPHSLLSRLENSWRHALVATLLSILVVIASFYWGLPWAAHVASGRVPARLTLAMDQHFLGVVDNGLMQPSNLSRARKNKLRQRFDALNEVEALPPHHLEFRSSPQIGANAFALPGGTVVVTDQLVALAKNDDEVLAVLAHELGHVSERHPLRQLLQSSVVGLAMTWYLGDISSLLAAAPTVLLETSYSRDFERRADRYAVSMLRMNGIAPTRLSDMLEKLEASQHQASKSKEQASSIAQFFSTHPDTSERIRDIRKDTK
jgi:Zn-dependent protease with chaperone function